MDYRFSLTSYDAELFEKQISGAMDQMTELRARKAFPKIWKYADKLNAKKMPTEVLEKRRARGKIYGVVLVLLGAFLFVPSVMEPLEMMMPLILSVFAMVYGGSKIVAKPRKENNKVFDEAAQELFESYRDISDVEVLVTEDGIHLSETERIAYDEIECVFETTDFLMFIWEERVTVLKKADLQAGCVDECKKFIASKLCESDRFITI